MAYGSCAAAGALVAVMVTSRTAAILSDVVNERGEDVEGFKLKDSTRISKANMFRYQFGSFPPSQDLKPSSNSHRMGKNKGSSNYKMADVNRLLDLVESYLPLGKDEWERLASKFNATRPRSWAERGFDSLHRKYKALYSTRKPTGKANIPPHIEQTKELKRAVDEKVNVVEMDDCAGVDSDEDPDEENDEEEERRIEPDFSFDHEPDGSLFHDRGGDGGAVDGGVDASNSASFAIFTGTEALAVDVENRPPPLPG
ncbi:hypothetical protein AM587_10007461 [Phytophthora nicotianae]|uniref:DUF6818 domain-containing protein n=1 Tax=Phytophthora nicotianae TaxID=4792 RepID=A0A0W8C164_PHYNI|nr:hypothetical protein AM587_10007461 [Phytophthora nicotianae]